MPLIFVMSDVELVLIYVAPESEQRDAFDCAPTPLNPAHFLDRAAKIFAERTAIVDGQRRFSYGEFAERSHRLAGFLRAAGSQPGDRIAALCTNSHVMLEMHNGVPMAGCALVPINTRLSLREMAEILEHSGARILIATHEFADAARALVRVVRRAAHRRRSTLRANTNRYYSPRNPFPPLLSTKCRCWPSTTPAGARAARKA